MEKKTLSDYIEFNNERLTKRVVFNDGESTVFVLNFQPGQGLPKHKHPGTNVYIHVLSGKGSMVSDGNAVSVEKGDVLVVRGDEEFSFENNGNENASLYVNLNKLPGEEYAKDA